MATPLEEAPKLEAALHVEVQEDVKDHEPAVSTVAAKKLGRKIDWRLLPMLSLV